MTAGIDEPRLAYFHAAVAACGRQASLRAGRPFADTHFSGAHVVRNYEHG
jgi:hypothetical protein